MIQTSSTLFSFGALLKTFRKRQHLTQHQLAEVIGVHRSTLIHWEQGNFLPESKTMVLELARHLHLDDQETRHLLEASLTALTPHWLVPVPRNPFFTGREEILEALHAQLGVDRAVALTQSSALHGLGGVGKTQIALEYAYRYALEYSAVFWIAAETDEQVIASLLHVAEVLQLSEREGKDQQRVIAVVQHWLTTHGQWLLIWDNVEDLEVLQRFLPAARSGAILITTRCQVLGTLARGLDLLPMEQEEGLLFLLRRAKVLPSEATSEQVRQLAIQSPPQYAAASELVAILGGLPLALDQAGAYLEETHCGLPAYLDLFRTRRDALLQRRGEGRQDHPASVSTTFRLSITVATKHHPAVKDLLQVCALLQPDAIPEELFRQGGKHLGPTLEAVCCDPLEWDQVVGIVCAYSLLSRQPEEDTLSIHRLVQTVLLEAMTDEEREQWSARVMVALDLVLPEVQRITEHAAWKQCEQLLPHALLCLQRARTDAEALPLASLAYKTACYLLRRGRYAEAEQFFQRALQIREQALGPEHPQVAASLNNLAAISLDRGKYTEAEQLFQRALQIREQALGPEHPEVASSLNNLAALFWEQGRYTQAEQLFQRTLRIREQVLGSEHLDVTISLINLAEVYWAQGKYTQAEALSQRGLQLREQALGPEHPAVASPLYILANLFREQGMYIEAERLYQRALRIWEQALSPEHPKVAASLNDLAECYRMQRRDAEAKPFYQRALQIWEQTLGPEHPDVAEALTGLANLFRDQNHSLEAEQFYQRALLLQERHLGQHHPKTAETLHGLALLRQKQGNLSEALSFAERALSIRSQSLGDAHHKTVASRALCAQLLQEQACAEGKAASERCLEALPAPRENELHEDGISSPLHEAVTPVPSENDPLQEFLNACCKLHPLAWCRISELWHVYEQWTASVQKRVPLPRRTFAAQVQARGCRVDRMSTARIWRGITLRDKTS